MSDVVIRVKDLSKEYRLGKIGHGTLYRDLQTGWAHLLKREDPNSKIVTSVAGQGVTSSDRFFALKDISFDVFEGETVGIIGRNGAGKSTLLKIISRVTAPTGGEIKIKGRVASLLEVGTGFHPELSGRENVFLNGAILGMRKAEIEQKFDEIVKFAEIEKFIDTPVKRYSSGMYVRLAFAVAAHLEPEILIVDEVLAVGDARFQKKCLGKMGEVAHEGRTVLFVSHNMAAVQQLCSRAILLDKGNIAFSGNVDDSVQFYLSHNCGCENNAGVFNLSKRINPFNNGKPIIQKVILLDENFHSKNTFLMGETLRILFEVEGLSSFSGSELGVAFNSAYDQRIANSSTWMVNKIIHNPRQNREFILLTIPKLPFTSGRWGLMISSTIHSLGIWLDKIENSIYFDIEESDVFKTGQSITKDYGFIYLPSEWEINIENPNKTELGYGDIM